MRKSFIIVTLAVVSFLTTLLVAEHKSYRLLEQSLQFTQPNPDVSTSLGGSAPSDGAVTVDQ